MQTKHPHLAVALVPIILIGDLVQNSYLHQPKCNINACRLEAFLSLLMTGEQKGPIQPH